MNRRAVVMTHHKTGTKWMELTFGGIASELGLRCHRMPGKGQHTLDVSAPCILMDRQSRWFRRPPEWLASTPDDRFLHLIRDPRDVVISGMYFHCRASEGWLHVPRDEFGGMTYQEKINSFSDDRSRLLFEMDNRAAGTIQRMVAWDYGRPECFECRYEDLVEDTSTSQFTKILLHLGFANEELETCRQQFWKLALFSRSSDTENGLHVRSGRKQQWQEIFDQSLGLEFLQRFPDALTRLGYEQDTTWVNATRPDSQTGLLAADA
ncbi:MAG TPA: hypothetical protein VHW69_04220 [Rhizomicrobium sp.]|nr:hypothetical protein [Rhizomicrobium sp.]